MLVVTVVFRTQNGFHWESACAMPDYFVAPQMQEVLHDTCEEVAQAMLGHTPSHKDDAVIALRTLDATLPGEYEYRIHGAICTVYVFHNRLWT